MATCSKSEIPERIIREKGGFHCKHTYAFNGYASTGCAYPHTEGVEYEPTDGDIVAVGMPSMLYPYGAYTALKNSLGPYVYLKNVVYEDEFMSWMSDPITISDAPVMEPILTTNTACANCACCGKFGMWYNGVDDFGFYPKDPPPVKCNVVSTYDVSSFTGSSTNVSWYGATLQFVVNLYRVYCCVKNEQDEIIDYDYAYNLISMYIKDGYTYLGSQLLSNYTVGLRNCTFCYPDFSGPIPVAYPAIHISVDIRPLPGDIYIPLKVKEF